MYISHVKIEPNNFIGEGISWSFSSEDPSNTWRWCQRSSSCSERISINPDNSLTIVDSRFNDVGIYTCEIKSLAGKLSISKTTYLPEMKAAAAELKHEYYEEGKDILLDCEFEVNVLEVTFISPEAFIKFRCDV